MMVAHAADDRLDRRRRPARAAALAGALAMALSAAPAAGVAGAASPDGASSAGMGDLGSRVQAGNRDCPPRGSPRRELSVPSAPGAVTCAPTGAGPATGYPPAPSAPARQQESAGTAAEPAHPR